MPSLWKLGGLTPLSLIRLAIHKLNEDELSTRSASLSYYFLLALFPLFLFLVSLIGVFALCLLMHNPCGRPHDGKWDGPLYPLGMLLYPNLRLILNVDALRFNAIEVLPVSQSDDAIRQAVARNIYNSTALDRYGFQGQPPIHIIVKQGRVTLEGVVDSESDKTVAGLKAREITGVFEVKNNLSIAQ